MNMSEQIGWNFANNIFKHILLKYITLSFKFDWNVFLRVQLTIIQHLLMATRQQAISWTKITHAICCHQTT